MDIVTALFVGRFALFVGRCTMCPSLPLFVHRETERERLKIALAIRPRPTIERGTSHRGARAGESVRKFTNFCHLWIF